MMKIVKKCKAFTRVFGVISVLVWIVSCGQERVAEKTNAGETKRADTITQAITTPVFDSTKYNKLLILLSNGDSTGKWPAKNIYPNNGAILPYKRVVAYYGNLFSTRMGALGEFPEDEMLRRLQAEVKKWEKADSATPVIPALHYIATTAQGAPGKEGKYILRMPFAQIDTILRMAKKVDGLVFLDVQVGLSSVQHEIPMFEQYLKMPNVHLGIDPEFSMKTGKRPGSVIGSYNADDINYVINYLSNIVKANNLTPKILVVHRFTKKMVQDYKNIKPTPEVQVVINMDGWGTRERKLDTYHEFNYGEPVQFTGFKIFYGNDTKRSHQATEMQPEEVLALQPRPIYIQYQ